MKEERKLTIYSPINQETHMKKILMMLALIAGTVAAYAQQSSGDYYEGLSRKIGFSRMIPRTVWKSHMTRPYILFFPLP